MGRGEASTLKRPHRSLHAACRAPADISIIVTAADPHVLRARSQLAASPKPGSTSWASYVALASENLGTTPATDHEPCTARYHHLDVDTVRGPQ